jgi:hypothetical protein
VSVPISGAGRYEIQGTSGQVSRACYFVYFG